MAMLSNISLGLSLSTAGFFRGIKSSKRGFTSLSNSIKNLASTFAPIGGIIAGALSVNAIKNWTDESMEAIDTTLKLADRLGTSTEAITGLGYAAELSGIKQEAFNATFEKFIKNIGEAKQGSKTITKGFEQLGLSISDISNMESEDAFLKVADAISKLKNPTDKAISAYTLFGRSGQQLISMFNGGEKGLRSMMREAEKLGITFSRFDAAKVEEANDAISRMEFAFKGVANVLAIEVSPYLTAIANEITNIGVTTEKTFLKDIVGAVASTIPYLGIFKRAIMLIGGAFQYTATFIVSGFSLISDAVLNSISFIAKAMDVLSMGTTSFFNSIVKDAQAAKNSINDTVETMAQNTKETFKSALSDSLEQDLSEAIKRIQASSDKKRSILKDEKKKEQSDLIMLEKMSKAKEKDITKSIGDKFSVVEGKINIAGWAGSGDSASQPQEIKSRQLEGVNKLLAGIYHVLRSGASEKGAVAIAQ